MKLAIHKGESWNKKWMNYCVKNNIEYIEIDCFENNVIEILLKQKVTHLLWHFNHAVPKDILTARNILFSAEKIGLKVFPNFNTSWHFDDKVSQKYLLESIQADIVPSYVFYDKDTARKWLENAEYPIVAKLRRGAGSYNVKLLHSYGEAIRYSNKMFKSGLSPTPGYLSDYKNKIRLAKNFNGFIKKIKKAPLFFKYVLIGKKLFPKEKGYVYFQKFIKNNKTDTRISVVDNIIWGFKRKVRKGDFRASGSGEIIYDRNEIDIKLVKNAYSISKKLKTQSVAFDFVIDEKGNYLIVEISYGYDSEAIYNCEGYWDANEAFNFVEIKKYPDDVIIDKFLINS